MPYDPGQNYAANPAPTAAGQGQTAIDAAQSDTGVAANTSGTSSGANRYYNQIVPGTRPRSSPDRDPRGVIWGPGKTLGQMQSDLYSLGVSDTDSLAALQTQLIKAGLLDPRARQFSLGSVSVGDPTDAAYTRLLSEAIKTGGDFNVLLDSLASNPRNTRGQRNYDLLTQQQAALAGAGTVTSSSYTLTDPNRARMLVSDAMSNHLGRKARPEEVQDFIQTLHSSEQANPAHQTQHYGGNGLPTSSVATSSPPDPSAMADAYAYGTQDRANEAGSMAEVGFLSVLERMLGVNKQGS